MVTNMENCMKMKKIVVAAFAAVLLAGPAQAQTCNDHIQAVAPDSRYTNHGNGTVTDTATGLMWKQCVEGLSGPVCASGAAQTFAWQGALQHAQGHSFAGYSDWRLPNINELSSLVEERCYGPSINTTLFPNTPSECFWSSSPSTDYSDGAWGVRFDSGIVGDDVRNDGISVRLVRGGQ
jgi:hypothetical protein